MNELSLIVDTNFFHECKEIETLNRAVLGNLDSINVIITSRVITELDNQKNSPKARIKRRALKINKILASILDDRITNDVIVATACALKDK